MRIDAFWLETTFACTLKRKSPRLMLELRKRENVSSSVSSVKESLDHWSDSFFYACRAHGSVHDEIRRGMLYQARSRWKLCFAVCSSVRSGADINLTLYEVYLKSSANASAKQRQMTFAENWILISRCNISQRVVFEKRSDIKAPLCYWQISNNIWIFSNVSSIRYFTWNFYFITSYLMK